MSHSIEVRVPLIKLALEDVFRGYDGINLNLEKLTFSAPFHEIFYRWTEFVDARPSNDKKIKLAREHFDLLWQVVGAQISPHLERASGLIKSNVISFEYFWTLFEPDTEIYARLNGQDRLYQLIKSHYGLLPNSQPAYILTCRYVDTDGEDFGFSASNLGISQFPEINTVADLDVVPSHFHTDIDEVCARLLDCGRKFKALKGYHYREYSGAYRLENPGIGEHPRQHVG